MSSCLPKVRAVQEKDLITVMVPIPVQRTAYLKPKRAFTFIIFNEIEQVILRTTTYPASPNTMICYSQNNSRDGWMVQWCWVNFQFQGVLLIWIKVGQGPISLAVGAGGIVWTFFFHLSFFFFLPLSGQRPDID